jgi:predicted alpha/beta-hydrolase family hydrolase
MGGRICSLVAGDAVDPVPALGLAMLGYPLHPPGKPDTLRVEHFKRLTMPVLFASGTRDAFGTPAELKRHAKKVKGPVTFHWVETGDHGFKPLKASGLTAADALRGVAEAVVGFVRSLA